MKPPKLDIDMTPHDFAPCPCCKGEPALLQAAGVWFVVHECEPSPKRKGRLAYHWETTTKAEAIAAWNLAFSR